MRIFSVLLWILFPGCWALTGPGAVRGPPGGSVAVRCRYQTGYERYQKFWCREGGGLLEGLVGGLFWSNGLHIVDTDGSEAEVTGDRVSIRDNHTQRVFTVTLDNLTRADAGTYHCGVLRTGLLDLRAAVEVTVSPGKSLRCLRQCRSCRARGRAGGRWAGEGGGCLDRQFCSNPGRAKRRSRLCARPGPGLRGAGGRELPPDRPSSSSAAPRSALCSAPPGPCPAPQRPRRPAANHPATETPRLSSALPSGCMSRSEGNPRQGRGGAPPRHGCGGRGGEREERGRSGAQGCRRPSAELPEEWELPDSRHVPPAL
ncbi:uncharacterized protein LOC101950127 [Chrysemys picta bellii]|uniref:uncharacterized protein LOC101950127 n=1 Tax=Chrysemys picta bellii TaxID=8478 RepID=UPI0032B26D77